MPSGRTRGNDGLHEVNQAVERNPSIDGIQFLRAIAALMVVAHHARHYFPQSETWTSFGSRGVDVFFVISGFIMAHATLAYQADSSRPRQAASFLFKRFVRVVPLYWLALLWTAKVPLIAGSADADLLKDFAFIPHFHAIYTTSVFPVLVPGWTINYEMFFYALFAASMLFGKLRFPILMLTLSALVVLGSVPWTSAPGIFYTSSVLLEFLFGIVVYFAVLRQRLNVRKPILLFATLAGFALLAIDNDDATRGFLDGPCAALIVGSTVLWAQGLKLDWLHRLGDASYSIYLFHLPSFWIASTLMRRAGIETATPLHVVTVLAVHVAVAIIAGLAIHQVIERPLLRALRPPARLQAPSLR